MSDVEFKYAYNYVFNEISDGTYEVDKILSKYDPDGELTLEELYETLSDEDKERVENILSPYVTDATTEPASDRDSAYDIFYNAWIQDNPDRYAQGILDFYEALKAEGFIDPSDFDDEE